MNKSRASFAFLLSGALALSLPAAAWARGKPSHDKADAQKKEAADEKADAKPTQIAKIKSWSVFATHGKNRTCYALARPTTRSPASLKRDDAYIFISTRPAEKVRDEVSVIMGFALKPNADPKADIGGASYDLVAKGANAWVKDPAQEGAFIEAMKKKGKLTVKAVSAKGNASTDVYETGGLGDALARVHKECP